MKEIAICTVLFILAVCAIAPAVLYLNERECISAWKYSGHMARYESSAGCLLSTDGGKTYIPATRYRVQD